MKEIRKCKRCGFILGTRPNLKDVDGVCSACINHDKKSSIDYESRQKWLTGYIAENKTNAKYDCLVAVSGGKDSTVIVKKLFENHGVKKALLVNVTDEFTHTKTGIHNLNNIVNKYNCDLLTFRVNPEELAEHMRKDLEDTLNPFKWLEEQIYITPVEIARKFNIKLVFFGENAEFEYGSSETLEIFHPATTDNLKIIYMGAIYPYKTYAWYKEAQKTGFIDLDHFNEWQRQGCADSFSSIDSIGYHMAMWTKFPKFGFQRVSDIACRLFRDGVLTYEQTQLLIKDKDYLCDSKAKRDFCRTINITEDYFDELVNRHANRDLLVMDVNRAWRRKDLI